MAGTGCNKLGIPSLLANLVKKHRTFIRSPETPGMDTTFLPTTCRQRLKPFCLTKIPSRSVLFRQHLRDIVILVAIIHL